MYKTAKSKKENKMNFTLENSEIRDNIVFYAKMRGYDKERIAELLNFPRSEGQDRDVTVLDLIKASKKLAEKPSLFIEKHPLLVYPKQHLTIEEFDKNYNMRHKDKEHLFLSVWYPCRLRYELLSFITTLRKEKAINNDIDLPLNDFLDECYFEMEDIWEKYDARYREISRKSVYESFKRQPVYETYTIGERILCTFDVPVKDFIGTAFFTGFDPVPILDGDAFSMSDRDYFITMFSDLTEYDKESVWMYARYLLKEKVRV